MKDETLTEDQKEAISTMEKLSTKLCNLNEMTNVSISKISESVRNDILSDLYKLRSLSDKKDMVVPSEVFETLSPELRMIALDSMLGVLAAVIQNQV